VPVVVVKKGLSTFYGPKSFGYILAWRIEEYVVIGNALDGFCVPPEEDVRVEIWV